MEEYLPILMLVVCLPWALVFCFLMELQMADDIKEWGLNAGP